MLNEHVVAAIVVIPFLIWLTTALIHLELRRISKQLRRFLEYHNDGEDATKDK